MTRERDDENLEAYLRQFHARAPRPLPGQIKLVGFKRAAVVAAAVAAPVMIGLSAMLIKQSQHTVSLMPTQRVEQAESVEQQISVMRLSLMAKQEPEKLDSRLDELSARLLPDVRSSQGVLKRLAHE